MTEMRAKLVIDADGTAIPRVTQSATQSLDQMMQSAVKATTGFGQLNTTSSRTSTSLSQITAQSQKLSASLTAQAQDLVATQRESAAYRAELNRVRAQFDPLFAASQAYEQELRAIADAERMGALSAETATAARTRAKAGFDAFSKSSGKLFASVGGGGMVMRNFAQQINQVGQQGAITGNYLGALAIQMPDILAGMGMWGALIGATTAVLAPMAVEVIKNKMALQSLDDILDDLDESTESATERLKILRDQDLSLTFGNMASDVRQLTSDLLALDRAAELKNLQAALDGLLSDSIKPGFWQKLSQSISLGAAPMPGLTVDDYLSGDNIRRENYGALTDGRGPSFETFEAQRKAIMEMAKSGDIEGVTAQMKDLINAFTEGGSFTDLNDELIKILTTLGSVATQTAEVEAAFNGSALQAAISKELGELSRGYREQTELASAVLEYGEQSANVEAVRNRHAQEALKLRLRELNVAEGSTEEQKALADLEAAQAAEAKVTAAERQKSISEVLTGLSDELSITQAIISGGEYGAEVERLRTEQAKETLRIKLEELGATDEQIAKAEELLEVTRKAAREQERAQADKKAGQSLAAMQREAQIASAILAYGKDSLQVKRMQIEAAREEYRLSLETQKISQQRKDDLLAQWDLTNGLSSADPFGSLAAAQSILRAQAENLSNLELEQALIGQSETVKRQTLALYEAELEIRKQNIDAESDLAQRIREGALAESDRAAQVEREADAWEKVQSSSETAIDNIVDSLIDLDFEGVFDGLKDEITSLISDLAISNPLKNALLGTDYGTLTDLGGLSGIWDRLTGQTSIDPASAAQAAVQAVGTMQVMATNVTISSMSGLGLGALGGAANINGGVGTSFDGATLSLTDQDIIDLKKTVATEWVPSAGADQAHGIIDTILNRIASGKWGSSVADVVNARSQFSDINGPVAWEDGRSSVSDISMASVSPETDAVVEQWLMQRQNGAVSSVGSHLAYANPLYSDASNMGWISELQGPLYGAGGAVHQHGTPEWMQPLQPGAFGVQLPSAELEGFSSTILDATQDLGTLGNGFDSFGQALASALTGGGGGTDFLGAILGALIPGFAAGGATGGSDPQKVAGVVHEKEYVFDAASTARIGVQNLEAIRRGTMKGYSVGGYVTAQSYPFLTQTAANSNAGSFDTRPVININNNSSAKIEGEVQEVTDARGQRSYELTMSDAVATGVGARGGAADRALRDKYALRRNGVSR